LAEVITDCPVLSHKSVDNTQPVTLPHSEALAGRCPDPVDCSPGVEEHEGSDVSAAHRRVDRHEIVLSNDVFHPMVEVRESAPQPQRCGMEALRSPNPARGRLDGVLVVGRGGRNDGVEVESVAVGHDRDAAQRDVSSSSKSGVH
jgi:hypothetical protein